MSEILRTSVVIVAGGKGQRMGKNYNKQYIILKDKPILAHTIDAFEQNDLIDDIILVVGKDEIEFVKKSILQKYNFKKVKKVVEGGLERRDSVYNGLKVVHKNCSIVLVHDGARPFVTDNIIKEGIKAVIKFGASVAAVPVKDTIKVVNEHMDVVNTPNRETLWSVQTPQFFKYELLIDAYERFKNSSIKATDDAFLMEKLGHNVKIIHGSYENIKITTPEDLIVGEGILKERTGIK